jgi:hypothetical protein
VAQTASQAAVYAKGLINWGVRTWIILKQHLAVSPHPLFWYIAPPLRDCIHFVLWVVQHYSLSERIYSGIKVTHHLACDRSHCRLGDKVLNNLLVVIMLQELLEKQMQSFLFMHNKLQLLPVLHCH